MAQVLDPDGNAVDAPGAGQWRYDTGKLADQGAGCITLSRNGTPSQNTQHTLYRFSTLPAVTTPPKGWSKATGFRLYLLTTAGIPLDAIANGLVRLEVRRVLSPGSPVIDLALSSYSQAEGFVGNLGDLRSHSGPLKFNLMFTSDPPGTIAWCQLILQHGAITL